METSPKLIEGFHSAEPGEIGDRKCYPIRAALIVNTGEIFRNLIKFAL